MNNLELFVSIVSGTIVGNFIAGGVIVGIRQMLISYRARKRNLERRRRWDE